MTSAKWIVTNEEQEKYIRALTDELTLLRAKAGISQTELCNMIGISRQTLSSIECRRKEMTWSVYLALLFFFDNNIATREMVRNMPAYPLRIINRMNEGKSIEPGLLGQDEGELKNILKELDEQALHTIKTMLLVEYARCKQIPGDVVIKAFEGLDLTGASPDAAAEAALRNIKNRKNELD